MYKSSRGTVVFRPRSGGEPDEYLPVRAAVCGASYGRRAGKSSQEPQRRYLRFTLFPIQYLYKLVARVADPDPVLTAGSGIFLPDTDPRLLNPDHNINIKLVLCIFLRFFQGFGFKIVLKNVLYDGYLHNTL